MIDRQAVIDRMIALFIGRRDAYLHESRHSVKESLTNEVLEQHLHGRARIGAYSLLVERLFSDATGRT